MHNKYDDIQKTFKNLLLGCRDIKQKPILAFFETPCIGLKAAFYIIDLAAGILLLLRISHHKQRGTNCPLILPSHPPHSSFSSSSDYHLAD